MKKDKHITTRVNRKLYEKVKEKAEREGMSLSEAIRYAIRKWTEND